MATRAALLVCTFLILSVVQAAERPVGNQVRFEMHHGAHFRVEIQHTFPASTTLDQVFQTYLTEELAVLPGMSNTIEKTWFEATPGSTSKNFTLRISVATARKNIVSRCQLTRTNTGFLRNCPLAFELGDTATVFEARTPGRIRMSCEQKHGQIDCLSSMEGEARGFSFLFINKTATDMATAYAREWMHDYAGVSLWIEGGYVRANEAKRALAQSTLYQLAKEIEKRADQVARRNGTTGAKPLVITGHDLTGTPFVSVDDPSGAATVAGNSP